MTASTAGATTSLPSRGLGFDLDEIVIPTQVWHDSNDLLVPIAHGRSLASRLVRAELHHLDDAGHPSLVVGRMQAEQLTGNLTRAGVRTDELVFSASGASRLARTLYGSLRDRSLSLPDDPETRAEFIATRMVETSTSTVRLTNPPAHDDIVAAVGMVVVDLTKRPDLGRGSVRVPLGLIPRRTVRDATRHCRLRMTLRRAASTRGAHAGAALIIPGSANDLDRR
ncbi:hypothetical protein GA707_14925 [Nostocoides sp. F2B08]|uniref:alpha/beta fold hydrolase n=1 Tax=Nostocoides sp. F2B08 TaxID=2653936 RepID=UPI001262BC15|nr:hypothetical protein [Tetrasphaera sp. F2B08]KAB7742946.1 hypothetical protein GA707_14925 [Tetrasphaera sp. F2B08]